jgi:hypothetical protein
MDAVAPGQNTLPAGGPAVGALHDSVAAERQRARADRELVATISYVASLSSAKQTVDPLLDRVRMITIPWKGDTPLADADRSTLQQALAQLKDQLLNHDPLREFTPASLEERIAAHLQSPDSAQSLRVTYGGVVGMAVIVAIGVISLPYTLPLGTRIVLSSPSFLLVSVFGVVWFFLSSLVGFKQELRRSFNFICGGTLLLALFFVHFVVVYLKHWDNRPLVRYGGVIGIATLSVFCMYYGLVLYARLMHVTSKFMSVWLYLACVAASGLVTTVIVLLRPTDHPAYFTLAIGTLWPLTLAAFFGAGVARSLHRVSLTAYRHSLRWMYIFMAGTFAGSIAYGIALIILGKLSGADLSAALVCFAAPPMLLLLYAGYSFKRETSR